MGDSKKGANRYTPTQQCMVEATKIILLPPAIRTTMFAPFANLVFQSEWRPKAAAALMAIYSHSIVPGGFEVTS
jgi:hypothetical protein